MELVALRPICYGNREYRRGDALPKVPEDVAGVWLESGSAIPSKDWQVPDGTRARLLTAMPGRTGIATPPSGGADEDLVGRIPPHRGAPPEPTKRRRVRG